MKISKQIANEAATSLLLYKAEKIAKAEARLEKLITNEYLKTIPKKVLEFSKSNEKYFLYTRIIRLNGSGFDFSNNFKTANGVPVLSNTSNFYALFNVDKDLAKIITRKISQISKLQKEYYTHKKQIEATLISLGTYNRIKHELPEAIPFIKKSRKQVLSVDDISQIRNLINSYRPNLIS